MRKSAVRKGDKKQPGRLPVQVKQKRGGIRAPSTGTAIVERFAELSLELRHFLKRGEFSRKCSSVGNELDVMVDDHRLVLKAQAELQYTKTLCYLSELFDYAGQKVKAQKHALEGQSIGDDFASNFAGRTISPGNVPLMREKIRLRLNYAHTHHYREQDYAGAKAQISDCLHWLGVLSTVDAESKCFGTCAQAYIYLGRAHRQLGEFDSAEDCFQKALDYIQLRLEHKSKQVGGLTTDEVRFANSRAAMCLCGIAWVNHKRGFLRRALYSVQPARLLLADGSDLFGKASADLIMGSIRRSFAGSDLEQLKQAVKLMDSAYNLFVSHHHGPYTAWAAFEIACGATQSALCSEYFDRLDQAEEDRIKAEAALVVLGDLGREFNDSRSLVNCEILRGKLRGDVVLLRQAIVDASSEKLALCGLEARIALSGVILRCLLDLTKSKKDEMSTLLNEAKTRCGEVLEASHGAQGPNPVVEATAHLLLAHIHKYRLETAEARAHLEKGASLSKLVDDVLVKELAEFERRSWQAFFVVTPVHPLVQAKEVDRLKKWLIEQAEAAATGSPSETKPENRIGAPHSTYYLDKRRLAQCQYHPIPPI